MKPPPIGVSPEWLWQEISRRASGSQRMKDKYRAEELFAAILRYAYADLKPDELWWAELRILTNRESALNAEENR